MAGSFEALFSLALTLFAITSSTSDSPSPSPSPWDCSSPQNCFQLASAFQLNGTQSGYLASHVVLANALLAYPADGALLGLYGKLHVFYLLQWSEGARVLPLALRYKPCPNHFIFNGWLRSTPAFFDVAAASASFASARATANATDFWPSFESAVFLMNVADNFTAAESLFQSAQIISPANPFIEFFYGVLLKYHLARPAQGQPLIDAATAAAPSLPTQAASNMAFQALLVRASGRSPAEIAELCHFALAIFPRAVQETAAGLVCGS